VINISYYSMYYNAVSLLAYNRIDIENVEDDMHVLTYQALVFYFHIQKNIIEEQYLDEFKNSMEATNIRLKTLAKQKSEEILSSLRKARQDR